MALTKAEIRALAEKISNTPEMNAISEKWYNELDKEYDKDFGDSKKQ